MPSFESPALYIDFARLPPPKVIEEINFEELLQRYRSDVVSKNDKLAAAVLLEQSPTNVILEAEAYGEMLVRARINAAARAVMLAFSTGSDLDNLAAFFGVERGIVTPADPNASPPVEAVYEGDDSLRRRAQMAPEAYTTAGSEGAYIFHALSANLSLRDASATKMDRYGTVKVAIMNSGADPLPTRTQIDAVVERLNRKSIKPLTDVVVVTPVKVKSVDIVANVTLYPGPDSSLVMNDIQVALTKVRDRVSLIGRDLIRSAIIAALNQEGVQNVELVSPSSDIICDHEHCALIKSAAVNVVPIRME